MLNKFEAYNQKQNYQAKGNTKNHKHTPSSKLNLVKTQTES